MSIFGLRSFFQLVWVGLENFVFMSYKYVFESVYFQDIFLGKFKYLFLYIDSKENIFVKGLDVFFCVEDDKF